MISDEKTNFLYLADTLPERFPKFWQQFESKLNLHQVNFSLLPETKDVWCRDYMPVQIAHKTFVQFVYQPGYLQTKKYKPTISDPAAICKRISIETRTTEIKLDGGNVVRSDRKAILTDKIFKENPQFEKAKLLAEIQKLLEVEKVFIIPKQPFDFTGHADGMVRFLDEDTLLVNNLSGYPNWFQPRIKYALKQTGLKLEILLYEPDSTSDSAIGTYINFLQIGKLIFVPVFEKQADESTLKKMAELHPKHTIVPVLSNGIAREGGVLNCISWNILK